MEASTVLEYLKWAGGLSVAGVGGWLLKRKKVAAEAEATELDNVEKAIAIWRKMSEDLTERVEDLQDKYDEVFQKYQFMEKEYAESIKKEHDCTKEVQRLTLKVQELEHYIKTNNSSI